MVTISSLVWLVMLVFWHFFSRIWYTFTVHEPKSVFSLETLTEITIFLITMQMALRNFSQCASRKTSVVALSSKRVRDNFLQNLGRGESGSKRSRLTAGSDRKDKSIYLDFWLEYTP